MLGQARRPQVSLREDLSPYPVGVSARYIGSCEDNTTKNEESDEISNKNGDRAVRRSSNAGLSGRIRRQRIGKQHDHADCDPYLQRDASAPRHSRSRSARQGL